jgi:hypothetical protein
MSSVFDDKYAYINKYKDEIELTRSTIVDYDDTHENESTCVVYKFQSRPPYEGFVLLLLIIIIVILLIYFLIVRFNGNK